MTAPRTLPERGEVGMLHGARRLLLAGALLGLTGVALGAFGAHAVKPHISADDYATFRIAAQYQLLHALAVFAAVYLAERLQSPLALRAGWLFVAGVVLFSGSLYLVATTGPDVLGAITPIGGLAFLAGWASLAWTLWNQS